MSFDIQQASKAAQVIDAAIKPIASRPVDINDPAWADKLKRGPHPLDRAGVRVEAEALMAQLLDAYEKGSAPQRQAIRQLFAANQAFVWATGVGEDAGSANGFKRHLLRLSADNGGRDMRDTIVAIDLLCQKASDAGIEIGLVLDEVAALSSDEVIHRMQSVRDTLISAKKKHEARASGPRLLQD